MANKLCMFYNLHLHCMPFDMHSKIFSKFSHAFFKKKLYGCICDMRAGNACLPCCVCVAETNREDPVGGLNSMRGGALKACAC